jgi:hypothetical protein
MRESSFHKPALEMKTLDPRMREDERIWGPARIAPEDGKAGAVPQSYDRPAGLHGS